MTDHAVITGTFSDAKAIKTRSVFQILVELPIESADAALKALGGWPQPGKEVAVAVARLNLQTEPKAKRGSLAQQAGMLCDDPVFVQFLKETYKGSLAIPWDAAETVREICGVNSRAEFDSNPEAGLCWRELKGKFDAWRLV